MSSSYSVFINNISSNTEPPNYKQVVVDSKWRKAIDVELKALESNDTWDIQSLHAGKQSISCKWVYKIKYNSDGTIELNKARLVAKGYTQRESVDYFKTFSLAAKMNIVKTLIAMASMQGWFLEQLDVNNAFLHRDLNEEVYMDLPLGYSHSIGSFTCCFNLC